jgi:hypothetical protein
LADKHAKANSSDPSIGEVKDECKQEAEELQPWFDGKITRVRRKQIRELLLSLAAKSPTNDIEFVHEELKKHFPL